ncbi:MAG: PTS sugar transporter subunit IIA [Clostridia bacterium]|nr:PTS sugar transporter subunit IIA [Clostridia bacterium]
MVGIVVLCHGRMAEALLETAEMIVGPHAQVASVPFTADMSLEDYRDSVAMASETVDCGDGALFLADLQGGTPCNVAALASTMRNSRVVTGVNVPMLVTVLLSREGVDIDDLSGLACGAGIEGIQAVNLSDGGTEETHID